MIADKKAPEATICMQDEISRTSENCLVY